MLAAIIETASHEDHYNMTLADLAIIAHAQLTRDNGAAMSSAKLAQEDLAGTDFSA